MSPLELFMKNYMISQQASDGDDMGFVVVSKPDRQRNANRTSLRPGSRGVGKRPIKKLHSDLTQLSADQGHYQADRDHYEIQQTAILSSMRDLVANNQQQHHQSCRECSAERLSLHTKMSSHLTVLDQQIAALHAIGLQLARREQGIKITQQRLLQSLQDGSSTTSDLTSGSANELLRGNSALEALSNTRAWIKILQERLDKTDCEHGEHLAKLDILRAQNVSPSQDDDFKSTAYLIARKEIILELDAAKAEESLLEVQCTTNDEDVISEPEFCP
jgi:hypothetical protein